MTAARVALVSVFALLVAACSGADSQELFGDPSSTQSDTSPVNPSPSPTTPATSSPAKPPADVPGPAPTATPTPTPTDPEAPPAKCTAEIEPNNDLAHPTPFTSGFCGKISSATDVDYGSFVVPKGATSITVKHSEKGGNVTYTYSMNGIPMLNPDAGLRAVEGATYVVEVRGPVNGGGNRPTYELDVSFK